MKKYCRLGTSLAIQELGLRASTVGGSIPGQGTKISRDTGLGQKKKATYCRLCIHAGVCSFSEFSLCSVVVGTG